MGWYYCYWKVVHVSTDAPDRRILVERLHNIVTSMGKVLENDHTLSDHTIITLTKRVCNPATRTTAIHRLCGYSENKTVRATAIRRAARRPGKIIQAQPSALIQGKNAARSKRCLKVGGSQPTIINIDQSYGFIKNDLYFIYFYICYLCINLFLTSVYIWCNIDWFTLCVCVSKKVLPHLFCQMAT